MKGMIESVIIDFISQGTPGRDINIETTNLKAGMYYIKVESETVKKTAKLVKK